ncbi:MAG: hypothetical protein JST49_03100 [Bacteroidetes bacterium]|nr:hypothetical protein [Bacteroidota bacterium]
MKTLTLSILIAVASIANAQEFKFAPKWQVGEEVKLEYIYSKNHTDKGQPFRDSIHANITLKLIAEDADSYIFTGQFINIYVDATKAGINIQKPFAPHLAKIALASPIVYNLNKESRGLKIVNEAEIDSTIEAIARPLDAKRPSKNEDSYLTSAEHELKLAYDLHIEPIIKLYFDIYTDRNLVLDKKLSIADANKGKKSYDELALGFGTGDGYALLSKTSPMFYQYHYEMNVDLSRLMPSNKNGAKAKGETLKEITVNVADEKFDSYVSKDILDGRDTKFDKYSITKKSLNVVK